MKKYSFTENICFLVKLCDVNGIQKTMFHSTTYILFLFIFSIKFVILVAASQENGGNPDNSLRNPGHRISAGLCYASQMTAILSHILDIRLPRKQPYRYIIPV